MKVLSRSAGGGLIRSRGVQRDHRGLDSSCGGCDNDTTSSTNLAAAKASFVSFFNAVGGITNYYGFLPFFSPGAARVWPSGKPGLVEAGPATAMSATSSQLTVNEPTDFVLVGKNRRELCDAALRVVHFRLLRLDQVTRRSCAAGECRSTATSETAMSAIVLSIQLTGV